MKKYSKLIDNALIECLIGCKDKHPLIEYTLPTLSFVLQLDEVEENPTEFARDCLLLMEFVENELL